VRTPLRSFGYKFSGYYMEYGPVEADSLDTAKAQIRRRLGVNSGFFGKTMTMSSQGG